MVDASKYITIPLTAALRHIEHREKQAELRDKFATGEIFEDPKTAAMGKEERAFRQKFAPGTKVKRFIHINDTSGKTYDFLGTVKELQYNNRDKTMEVGVIWDYSAWTEKKFGLDWYSPNYLVPVEPQGELFDKSAAIGKEERALRETFAVGTRVCWVYDYAQEGTITGILRKVKNRPELVVEVKWDNLNENNISYSSVLIPLAQQRNLFNPRASQDMMKTAISLPDIVRQTNQFSKKYRPGCTPTLIDSNPKTLSLHYNVKCNKEDSDPAGHDVRVQFDVTKIADSQRANDLDVKCNCSCPAFLMWGAQWNLHQRDGLLPPTRPLLQAPKERLDLRGNYVICKHIHCVFERILPSVQHNIVKILREREIRNKKDRVEKIPQELQEKQKEMKEKRELEKIHDTKDKKVKDRLLQKLQDEEETRLLHEKELEEKGNEHQEDEIQRDQPATEPVSLEEEEETTPAWMRLPEHYEKMSPEDEEVEAIQDLTQQEETKIEQLHEEGKPHLHKGLPYDVDEDPDEMKGKGWKGQRLSSTRQKFKKGDKVIVNVPDWLLSRSSNSWSSNVDAIGEILSCRWSKEVSSLLYVVKWRDPYDDRRGGTNAWRENEIKPLQQDLFKESSTKWKFRVGDYVVRKYPLLAISKFSKQCVIPGEIKEIRWGKRWGSGEAQVLCLVTWTEPVFYEGWIVEDRLNPAQQELFKEGSTKHRFRKGDKVIKYFSDDQLLSGEVEELDIDARDIWYRVRWYWTNVVTGALEHYYTAWELDRTLMPAQQSLFKTATAKFKFRVGDRVRHVPGWLLSIGTITKRNHKGRYEYEVLWDAIPNDDSCTKPFSLPAKEVNLRSVQLDLFDEESGRVQASRRHKFKVGDRVRWYNHLLPHILFFGTIKKLIFQSGYQYIVLWDAKLGRLGMEKPVEQRAMEKSLRPMQLDLFDENPHQASKRNKVSEGDLRPHPQQMQMFDEEKTSARAYKFQVGDEVQDVASGLNRKGTVTFRLRGKESNYYNITWDTRRMDFDGKLVNSTSFAILEKWLRSTQEELPFEKSSAGFKYAIGDRVIHTHYGDLGKVQKKYTQMRQEGFFYPGEKIYIIEWDGWLDWGNGKIKYHGDKYKTKTPEHSLDLAQINIFKDASGWKWRIGEHVRYKGIFDPNVWNGVVIGRYRDKNTGERHYVIRWRNPTEWMNGSSDIAEEADKEIMDKITPQQSELFKEAATKRKWVQGERIVYQPDEWNREKIYKGTVVKVYRDTRGVIHYVIHWDDDNWKDPKLKWDDSYLGEIEYAQLLRDAFPPVQRELFEEV